MASQLLRVFRGFARAARQAAAPVARVGSGGAAPSDLPRSRRCLSFLRGGSAVDTPPLGRGMSSHTDASSPDVCDFSDIRRCLSFLRGGSAVDTPPLGRGMSSHTDAPSPDVCDFDMAGDIFGTTDDKVERFVADDKDLASDEALWALYERWCKFFDMKRDHDEMVRYFPKFKESALAVDRVNKANLPYKFGFNQFSDGKLQEYCSYNIADFEDLPPFAKAKGTVEEDESNRA